MEEITSNLTCCKFVALKENTPTLFNIITVIRPSTLLRVFFIGGSGFETKGGTILNLTLLLDVTPHPSPFLHL